MATSTRENKFYHCKSHFQGFFLRENIHENLEIQVKTSNRSLRTPNKVILEYVNLQKQQSFYISYANTVYNELPNEIKNVNNIQQQLVG